LWFHQLIWQQLFDNVSIKSIFSRHLREVMLNFIVSGAEKLPELAGNAENHVKARREQGICCGLWTVCGFG
jgi:hypothetical protein